VLFRRRDGVNAVSGDAVHEVRTKILENAR
jgi:hypothetical protein